MMDDLTIAFTMRCDQQNLTFEEGVRAAADLADEMEQAAEDRASYARRDGHKDEASNG